ncbi:Zinc-finger domain of monoamine-oxidase A repressor R1 [Musa troglodytarum]|uniref:Zinc-finger domain of monoamine-oxidase A repressor R1 n=1 Tax=Musa troglodytarum TaxID=320322 RepID=A0A9E7I088_9LILI|nr:Zinc-finger domain of monoamine-oxidase A repressor R1 [Musa troglodytarum]
MLGTGPRVISTPNDVEGVESGTLQACRDDVYEADPCPGAISNRTPKFNEFPSLFEPSSPFFSFPKRGNPRRPTPSSAFPIPWPCPTTPPPMATPPRRISRTRPRPLRPPSPVHPSTTNRSAFELPMAEPTTPRMASLAIRQRTTDFGAPCRQIRKDKHCPIKFCYKCLLNRYGEKAEEVALMPDWSCPKCRGVCNCSCCMKKKGHLPTGILIHTAKATGFSSVHELLYNQGSDVLAAANGLRSLSVASPDIHKKGSVAHKRSHGKENYLDEPSVGGDDKKGNSQAKKETKRASKKLKRGSECGGENVIGLCSSNAKPKDDDIPKHDEKKPSVKNGNTEMQPNNDKPVHMNCINDQLKGLQHLPNSPEQPNAYTDNRLNTDAIKVSGKKKIHNVQGKPPCKVCKIKKHGNKYSNIAEEKVTAGLPNKKVQLKQQLKDRKSRKYGSNNPTERQNLAIVIPQGASLIEVAGVDWAVEDVGAALQFLEFCNAFSEVLDVKKGEPVNVLRELSRGCVGRRGVHSSIVKFHIKLLMFIQKDMGNESVSYSSSGDKWLQSVVNCINDSECALKVPLECLNKDSLGYDGWDASNKLKLLNLLCDVTLGTEELRNWIDKENKKYIERNKEANETIIAAKKKGKYLKKKLKDDVAKAMLSLKEGSHSDAEHENLVSQIRAETEKAHAEMLEIMERLPKDSDNTRQDAVRTEPLLLEGEGRVYWTLGGFCSNSKIILQDIGTWDSVILEDKWFTYGEEEKNSVARHISSGRNRRQVMMHGGFLEQDSEDVQNIGCYSRDKLISKSATVSNFDQVNAELEAR